ncbi:quinone-dependent dihydroorotate dehydrogenase [Cnuibacter physcomitrellae]|uniref:quinone-dependent dihydroorotate dehydrogenase n=1 Tax=Cnuibacter physcomitrellae TaxID=1619308 RepID=UPI002175A263|nr:quinone-dependent dihydroorotate dehydrogenase [Cnuibacter physcomitrellae]MCS5498668.1 quinone-dependent dihydroorotate dehydrogenase [Cnuibacter physcomitrellae]
MYELLFRTVLSRMDPEDAHHLAMRVIRLIPRLRLDRLVHRFTSADVDLSVKALGLTFPTPFGVAAGFDKDGTAIDGLAALGFGHVEVGTITARPQPGNDRPRLFRLIADRAVINRMGFNNRGAAAAALRLARTKRSGAGRAVIGVNIGKSRVVSVEDAIADYVQSARALAPIADYLVVNVSSPNTPGLRGLQELDLLAPLLEAVKAEARSTPLLVKIAPDLTDEQLDRIAELAVSLGLDGIIATNTTLSREGLRTPASHVEALGAGGLSGAPLAERSLAVLKRLRTVLPPEFCVISVGGVDTAYDVEQRLLAGATLVQGYTAFLYRGPLWAKQINVGLARLARTRVER